MAKTIIMPKFEMAQETGTVSRWLKNEGDRVEKGEAILEVETDKVNMEVESPAGGILAGINVGPGDTVPIGRVIAYILEPGEELPEEPEPEPAPAAPPAATEPADSLPRATPVARRVAQSHGVNLKSIAPTGEGGRITRADVQGYLDTQSAASSPEDMPDKVRAVPAARRLARELGVNLKTVSGTGPNGRVQSDDVRRASEKAAAPTPAVGGQPAVRRTVPLTGMRQTIADRMAASVRQAPQFTVSMDVAMRRSMHIVDDLRATAAQDDPRVTMTAFLVKACAWVLSGHPAINASFDNDNIVEWADINVGVAVALDTGLIVPVIHKADTLGIRQIAARLLDLGTRARQGQLRSQDVQGGTFTISNLGMFGVDRFTAILNPPQAAILAVSRIAKRPVVTDDDQIEIRHLADFTLTADHRVIDGALAGRFLANLKQAIERPGVLL